MLRTRNSYLSVIGVISPMIGLLGTVIGMMKAFAVLGAQRHQRSARRSPASIGEVLLATASGLFIAIPAFISYYVFRNRAQQVIVHADDKVSRLLEDIPYEELAGAAHRRELQRRRSRASTPAAAQSRRVSHGAHHELPRLQRRRHSRRESLPALRRHARLGRLIHGVLHPVMHKLSPRQKAEKERGRIRRGGSRSSRSRR